MAERAAVLTDVHGNLPALEAVLDDVRRAGCARVFVLGDVVNGIDPAGCLEALLEAPNVSCVKGNAELYVLTPDLEAFPMRTEGHYAELLPVLEWWKSRLSPPQMAALDAMPEAIIADGACYVHDSPLDRFFPERRRIEGVAPGYQELCYHGEGIGKRTSGDALDEVLDFMDSRKLSRLFCGHTHVPFVKDTGRGLICNAGSVGMPLDGDPRAGWILVDGGDGGRVSIMRTEYDVERAVGTLGLHDCPRFGSGPERARTRNAYAKMLRTGVYWRVHLGR